MHAPLPHIPHPPPHVLPLTADDAETAFRLYQRLLTVTPTPVVSHPEERFVGMLRAFLVRCGRLPGRQV